MVSVFPGQGAQFPKMGLDLYEKYESVRDLFALASSISSVDLHHLLEDGSDEDLQKTHYTQLLITLINRACSIVLKDKGWVSICSAGFSLGELSAYKEASIFTDETLFSLVASRGNIMAKHGYIVQQRLGSIGMAAVIGLNFDSVESIIRHSHIDHLYAANDNSATQVVISGLFSSLEKLKPLLKEKGAKRIIPLKVSGPFHTPLMEDAKLEFMDVLTTYEFMEPTIPIYSNVHASLITSTIEAKKLLADQLTSPVRWSAIVKKLEDSYRLQHVIEVGPNNVLTNLFRSTTITCCASGSVENIEKLERKDINE